MRINNTLTLNKLDLFRDHCPKYNDLSKKKTLKNFHQKMAKQLLSI